MVAPILVIAIGNESRGDDALGPLLLRRLEATGIPDTEFIEDFQLQVEHATDLEGRRTVLFIDADMSCAVPFEFGPIAAAHDRSYTSHAMTPAALLHAFRQVYGCDAPPCFLLRIRGQGFELGESLSPAAQANLQAAFSQARNWLTAACRL